MMISLIVAMDQNRVIGLNNEMPWHLPNDLKHFKKTTTGHTIVMGRKTFESIGRILPNRKHVVLTRSDQSFPQEVEVLQSIEQLINYIKQQDDEVFILGGGQLYKKMLPYTNKMYITLIDDQFKGDTYFPTFDEDEWDLISKKKGLKDEENPYDYYFMTYVRHCT